MALKCSERISGKRWHIRSVSQLLKQLKLLARAAARKVAGDGAVTERIGYLVLEIMTVINGRHRKKLLR